MINRFINSIDRDVKIYKFILEELERSYNAKQNLGRRSLELLANEKGLIFDWAGN